MSEQSRIAANDFRRNPEGRALTPGQCRLGRAAFDAVYAAIMGHPDATQVGAGPAVSIIATDPYNVRWRVWAKASRHGLSSLFSDISLVQLNDLSLPVGILSIYKPRVGAVLRKDHSLDVPEEDELWTPTSVGRLDTDEIAVAAVYNQAVFGRVGATYVDAVRKGLNKQPVEAAEFYDMADQLGLGIQRPA